jgi:hypothetical protein
MSTNNVSLSFFSQITQKDNQKQVQNNFDKFSNVESNIFANEDVFINSNSEKEIADEFMAMQNEMNAFAEGIDEYAMDDFSQGVTSYEYQDTYDKLNTLDSVFKWFD